MRVMTVPKLFILVTVPITKLFVPKITKVFVPRISKAFVPKITKVSYQNTKSCTVKNDEKYFK